MYAASPRPIAPYRRIVESYLDAAGERSRWGLDTARIVRSIRLNAGFAVVVELGCGSGETLRQLAATASPLTRLVGVEPSPVLRERAAAELRALPNVEIRDGFFDEMPLASGSVDYLYSIGAFEWVSDVDAALLEMKRVLKPGGLMDHFFTGRDIGREFIHLTTPIFLRYLGSRRLLEAARLRQTLTLEAAKRRFASVFHSHRISASESYDTHYDTVDGYLRWWRRLEPQLLGIPEELRPACEAEVADALRSLETEQGVPYTKHVVHIQVASV